MSLFFLVACVCTCGLFLFLSVCISLSWEGFVLFWCISGIMAVADPHNFGNGPWWRRDDEWSEIVGALLNFICFFLFQAEENWLSRALPPPPGSSFYGIQATGQHFLQQAQRRSYSGMEYPTLDNNQLRGISREHQQVRGQGSLNALQGRSSQQSFRKHGYWFSTQIFQGVKKHGDFCHLHEPCTLKAF